MDSRFINRELSWMQFNRRVLDEAKDTRNPLLERCKFLAITASNLDEFFMVRVSGLKEQIRADYTGVDVSGYTPKTLMKALAEDCHGFQSEQTSVYRQLLHQLEEAGIHIRPMGTLSYLNRQDLERYFQDQVFPVLTPIAVDTGSELPHLSGRRMYIAVRLEDEAAKKANRVAVVQLPSILPRLIPIPGDPNAFVLLEDLLSAMLPRLFDMHPILGTLLFRVTRNGDLTIDDEASDLVSEIERSIRKRSRGAPVRLEWQTNFFGSDADVWLKDFLISRMKLKKKDVYPLAGPLDMTFLMHVPLQEPDAALSYGKQPPSQAIILDDGEDMFGKIRKGDILLHHPYQSFDPVLALLRQASEDPDVLAIKQTLYRVSKNSPVVKSLVRAAEAGKQVTVLVELKARFDEENNIGWARVLEHAGAHVIYGIASLKVHCKALLIVRREEDRLVRYMHLGTGNYNESTARLYSDFGLLTCNGELARDVTELFNVITGYTVPPVFARLHVAPSGLRSFLTERILAETQHAAQGNPAEILLKMNSLVDPELIQLLYDASSAGVKIRCIVRGICCLRPGVPGLSENIQVISIVGRYLEHHRIFYFLDGGKGRTYLSSADWMERNLDRRIETCFPVDDEALKERLLRVLHAALADREKARIIQPDGSYRGPEEGASGGDDTGFQQWCYMTCKAYAPL